jgi:hypothetical protein
MNAYCYSQVIRLIQASALARPEPPGFHPAKQWLKRRDPGDTGNEIEKTLQQYRPFFDEGCQ